MGQFLRLLKNPASFTTLSTLFPSNAVFDLDATIAASFAGGQVWQNIISAPADGATQSAYNFNLGASSSVSTDDPTFTGNSGTPSAYFALDGGDYFTLAGTITSFLNSLHKGTSHTLIMVLNHDDSASQDIGLFSTTDTYNSANTGISYYGGWSFLFYKQRVGATLVSASSGAIIPATAADRIIVVSYNSAANTVTRWVNSSTGTSVAMTYTVTYADQVGSSPAIGAVGASSKMPNGTKFYSCAMLNSAVVDADVAKIITFYNARHGRTYA